MDSHEERAPQKTKWKIYVKLEVSGFRESPDHISALIGVEPTRTYMRGDSILRTRLKRKYNGWTVDAPCRHNVALAKQVDILLEQLAASAERFTRLPDGAVVLLLCAVYDYRGDAALYFSKRAVSLLALLGAEISLDYYDLRSE